MHNGMTQPAQLQQVDGDAEMAGSRNGSVEVESGDDSPNGADPTSTYARREPMGDLLSPPPLGGEFPTFQAIQDYVLKYCTSVGYAVVIGRSKKTVPGLKKVLFVCDKAGKPPQKGSSELRKRKTKSRKCDCPFGFFAIEQRDKWIIRYRPDQEHLRHNHPPSESPQDHPAARKLTSRMAAIVKECKDKGKELSQEASSPCCSADAI